MIIEGVIAVITLFISLGALGVVIFTLYEFLSEEGEE